MDNIHEEVKDYYGKTLKSSSDLKTNACCTNVVYPNNVKDVLKLLSDEVVTKYYGCGLCIPTTLNGLKVLDLGSGSGRDCYIISALVGEAGSVTGVDMTDEQLEVANSNIDYHMEQFSYSRPNVEFKKGNIEALDQLNLNNESYDLIVSNCVINLAMDKKKVLTQAHRILKEGGELYFSDVYSDRRVPDHLRKDPVLWGECLSGALYWNDFVNLAKECGFADPRLVESSTLEVNNKEVSEKLEGINFYSATYRLFKIRDLEAACEEYGQMVRYNGGVENMENQFQLDDHHIFQKGKWEPVCGNTYLMLSNTRFENHFDFAGDFDKHFGIFEGCGLNIPFKSSNVEKPGSGACC